MKYCTVDNRSRRTTLKMPVFCDETKVNNVTTLFAYNLIVACNLYNTIHGDNFFFEINVHCMCLTTILNPFVHRVCPH